MSEEKNILAERYNISSNNFIKEKSEENMNQTRTKKIETIKSQKYKYKFYYNNTENQKIIKEKRNAANINSNEIGNFTDENINIINIKNNNKLNLSLNDRKYLIENSKNNIKENNYISNLKYQSKYFSKNSNVNNANYSNIVNITSKYSSGVSKGVKLLKKNISENSKSSIYNSENISHKKLKANCETNYSINQITNVKYVNGTNKKMSKNNYKRFPDIFFNSKEKNKGKIKSDNIDNIIKKDLSTECLCDINSKCMCGKRKYNKEINYLDENKDLNNYENHIKTINIEAYPVIFSNNDNSDLKSKKHKIIINRNNKDNYNIFKSVDNIRYEKIANAKMNKTTDLNNSNICKCFENEKNYSSTKKNHIFKSICNCSKKEIKLNMNMSTNTNSSKLKEISDLKKNNICINIKKGMNRSISYENAKNKKSNKCSSEEYKNYILEKSNKNFDEEELRMQNIQNLNIIQDKKLYQIIVPLQENKIDYQCGIEIIRKSPKKYTLEEIDEILKNEKSYNQSESLTSKKFSILLNNWNETNEVVNTNKIILENVKKENEDDLDKTIEKPKQLNIEAFSININDEGRRFKGEMFTENISIEYKNQNQSRNKIKSQNYNLSLSKNETIVLNADYPRKDWNNITRPIRGKNISFETSHKLVLIGENVERILIKGNEQPKKDWNIYNNEKKEVNINLCQSKKNKKLSKQRLKPLLIKGEEDNNNFAPKESEPKVIINGFQIKNKKIEKNKNKNKNKENKLLINNDNNPIKENKNRYIVTNIKKVQEISEESISSEIDVLKNIKKINKQINLNNGSGIDKDKINDKREIKVIINDISQKYPKKVETFHDEDNIENKKEQHVQIIKNEIIKNNLNSEKVINYGQIQQNEKQINLYFKKKIITNNNNIQPNSKVLTNLEQNQEPIDKVRQYYDKENIKLNSENGQNLNKIKIINNYNDTNQFLKDQTYKKEIKYKQETIENLTPIKSERPDDGIYKINENYDINFEMNENINKQNLDENVNKQKIIISNENQNERYNSKPIQFQPDYTYINNIEQKIPCILYDDEDNNQNFNNYNYNEMINEQNQTQPQIQYIYKKDINKKYIKQIIKKQEKNEEDKNVNINIINNINSQKNEINDYGQQFQIKQINYELNYPEQEQENLLTLEESKHFKKAQNLEEAQENNINIQNNDGIFNQLQEIESNNDINVNKYINNDEDITNYNIQQQLDISKTQELIEEPISASQNKNDNKYSDFIQGFSHHLKTTPSDNFNKFAINKLNIIPLKSNSNDDNKNQYLSNMAESQ